MLRAKLGSACLMLMTLLRIHSAVAASASPWDNGFGADPKEILRAATAEAAPSGENLEILLQDISLTFDAQGRRSQRYRVVYRPLTEAGVAGTSTVSSPWEPWHEKRPELKARVITVDGQIHELDAGTIGEAPSDQKDPVLFEDGRILRAPLPAIAVGSIVEFQVTSEEIEPAFSPGNVHRYAIGMGSPIRRLRIQVEAPKSLALSYELTGVRAQVIKTEAQGRQVLKLELGPLPKLAEREPLSPPDPPDRASLVISTAPSWGAVAAGYSVLVDKQLSSVNLQPMVKEIAAGAEHDRHLLADKILAWMHRSIRYTGVEFGNASIVPRTPSEVQARHYGDCKDMATLLVGLLRAAGWPAHVALLRTRRDAIPRLPGINSFDHAIVYLPGSPGMWIDPTSRFSRADELPPLDQGRDALIAAPRTVALSRTPESSAEANKSLCVREVSLSEMGSSRVVESFTVRGSLELQARWRFGSAEEEKLKNHFKEYAKSAFGAPELNEFSHTDVQDLSKSFELRMAVTGATVGMTDRKDAAARLSLAPLFEELPRVITEKSNGADGAKRKEDLLLELPYVAELRYRVIPPLGFVSATLPQNEKNNFGSATLERAFSKDSDNSVTATFRFNTGKGRFTPSELESLRNAVQNADGSALTIRFESSGEALLASGRIREAIQEFNSLISAHPQHALHHEQLARALLAIGAGEAARVRARKAIELEPASSSAYKTLGWILQHDLIGRRFHKGFEFQAAVNAYRKACELDPKDFEARGDLAILLEHNSEGERYGSGAKLKEAIAEYRAMREEFKDLGSLDDNLVLALFQAGEYSEVKRLTRSMNESFSRRALQLAASALSSGPSAALGEAKQLITDPENRRKAILASAMVVLSKRSHLVAAELLKETSAGAANSAAIDEMAALLRKTQRFEDVIAKTKGPSAPVLNLLASVLSSRTPSPDLASRANRPLRSEMKELSNEATKSLAQIKRLAAEAGFGQESLADMIISLAEPSAEGDDVLGYRVKIKFPNSTPGQIPAWFVVRDGAEYRILSVASHLPPLGRRVFELAESGDLKRAEQWMDWLRDEVREQNAAHPHASSPFLHFWRPGAPRERSAIVVAAATLAVDSDRAERAVNILEAAREKAGNQDDRKNLDLSLAQAYRHLKRYDDLVALADRMLSADSASELGFSIKLTGLSELKRIGDAAALAEERLKKFPGDATSLSLLLYQAQLRSDHEAVERFGRMWIESSKGSSNAAVLYNNLAWHALMRNQITAKAFEDVRTSIQMDKRYSSLHTLAALYAESGKPNEARQTLWEALDAKGMDDLDESFWYVYGRIAEDYGLREVALDAYRRVKPPGKEKADIAELVQRRLSLMQSAASR